MKTSPALVAAPDEGPVLGRKAVAGMELLGAGTERGRDDLLDVEVAVRRPTRAQRDRSI